MADTEVRWQCKEFVYDWAQEWDFCPWCGVHAPWCNPHKEVEV